MCIIIKTIRRLFRKMNIKRHLKEYFKRIYLNIFFDNINLLQKYFTKRIF